MEAIEATPGTAVRVGRRTRRTEFTGMGGTIERRFGESEYPALDVRLDNGRRELFWLHQLEKAEEN